MSDSEAVVSHGEADKLEQAKMRQFFSWLEQHGAYFPALQVEEMHGMRGIKVEKAFRPNQLVMRIPRSLWITWNRILASPVGELLSRHEASGTNVTTFTYFSAFLHSIKKEGGFWAPYVEVLPEQFPGHPLLFTPSELAYLKGSFWFDEILRNQELMAQQYREVIRVCFPDDDSFTFECFLWGVLAAMTRVYTVKVEGEVAMAMVPLADMLNHFTDPNIDWNDEASVQFSFVTNDAIDAGMELRGSYGARSKGTMFRGYGFCVDKVFDGGNDTAKILLPSLPEGHPSSAVAKHFGTRWDADSRAFEFRAMHGTPGVRALFSYLRLLAHVECEGGAPVSVEHNEEFTHISPLGRDNEVQVLSRLEQICTARLRGFETSIEEDGILLKQNALPQHLRYAVMVRHGEKQVLQHFIDLAKTAIPLLKSGAGLDGAAAREVRFSGYFSELGSHLMAPAAA